MVRIPIATSIKKVEKPVTLMDFSMENSFVGLSSRRVFLLPKKCVSIMSRENTEPITVARPAPITPISNAKTKNQEYWIMFFTEFCNRLLNYFAA